MPPGCPYVKPTGLVQLKVQKQCINRILRTSVTVNPPEYIVRCALVATHIRFWEARAVYPERVLLILQETKTVTPWCIAWS